jgi:UDP-2,3-diacylglucosamine pyrophosphatase LpxH
MMENSSGQSIYIEHGHNADYLNGTVPGRIISKFGFFLLKLLTRWPRILKLYFRVVEFEEHLNRLPKRYNTYKYLQYALKLLKTYDLVVLGHTHKLESHHTYYLNKKKRYVNSGSCSLGRFQGVLLDTESLKYEIIRMDKSIKILKNDKPVYIRIPFSA